MKMFESVDERREFMNALMKRHDEFDLWRRMFEVALGGVSANPEPRPPGDRVKWAAKIADEAAKLIAARRVEAFREFDEPASGGSSQA